MIVTAAAQLRQQYTRLSEAKQVKNRVSQIVSTRTKLEEIEPCVREPITIFRLIHDRLPAEDRDRLGERLQQLEWMLRQSRDEFARDRRQVTRLDQAAAAAGTIVSDLDAVWRRTSTLQGQPFHDLWKLVRQLPVVAAQAQALLQALHDLDQSANTAPRNTAQLARFGDRSREVERRAQAFEALPTAVQEFLRRVTEEIATLEDLTPDVVDWLREQGHLGTLAVRFVGRPSS